MPSDGSTGHTNGVLSQLRQAERNEDLPDPHRGRARRRRQTLEARRQRDRPTEQRFCDECERVTDHEVWDGRLVCKACVVGRIRAIQDDGYRAVRRQRGGR